MITTGIDDKMLEKLMNNEFIPKRNFHDYEPSGVLQKHGMDDATFQYKLNELKEKAAKASKLFRIVAEHLWDANEIEDILNGAIATRSKEDIEYVNNEEQPFCSHFVYDRSLKSVIYDNGFGNGDISNVSKKFDFYDAQIPDEFQCERGNGDYLMVIPTEKLGHYICLGKDDVFEFVDYCGSLRQHSIIRPYYDEQCSSFETLEKAVNRLEERVLKCTELVLFPDELKDVLQKLNEDVEKEME